MGRIIKNNTALLTGVMLLFFGFSRAHAEFLGPSDLNPGDMYRLIFVTDGRTKATEPSLDYYHNFVSEEVANYCGELNELGTNWRAIVSQFPSPYSDARWITDTIPYPESPGVPIYNTSANGSERIASDYNDLWDGQITACICDGRGTPVTADQVVWTGTDMSGQYSDLYLGVGDITCAIGFAAPYPEVFLEPGLWIEGTKFDRSRPTYEEHRLYGISDILTVPQPVPAPTSMVLLSSGLFCLLGLRRKGRKV